jgi:hypothetical protein
MGRLFRHILFLCLAALGLEAAAQQQVVIFQDCRSLVVQSHRVEGSWTYLRVASGEMAVPSSSILRVDLEQVQPLAASTAPLNTSQPVAAPPGFRPEAQPPARQPAAAPQPPPDSEEEEEDSSNSEDDEEPSEEAPVAAPPRVPVPANLVARPSATKSGLQPLGRKDH